MPINEKVQNLIAKEYSCSQVTFGAICEEVGVSLENAMKQSACFGGGIGMGDTCGAISGALMALGYLSNGTPEEKHSNHERSVEFIQAFIEKTGSRYCREHLGFDLGTPEGGAKMEEMHAQGTPPQICEKLMNTAVEMFIERLDKYNRK